MAEIEHIGQKPENIAIYTNLPDSPGTPEEVSEVVNKLALIRDIQESGKRRAIEVTLPYALGILSEKEQQTFDTLFDWSIDFSLGSSQWELLTRRLDNMMRILTDDAKRFGRNLTECYVTREDTKSSSFTDTTSSRHMDSDGFFYVVSNIPTWFFEGREIYDPSIFARLDPESLKGTRGPVPALPYQMVRNVAADYCKPPSSFLPSGKRTKMIFLTSAL